jgi:hypothetical protein
MHDVYQLDPSSHALSDASISAEVRRAPSGDWEVIVVIVRAPDQTLIQPSEVGARLLDEHGKELALLTSPSKPLAEAGGSLGVSANARFEFADCGRLLAELVVRFRDEEVRFSLTPA